MNQTIAIIGATGMLGEPVARQLAQEGYAIRVVARNPEKARQKLGSGFEIVPGDAEKPETLLAALAGCYGVHVNLAGGPSVESYERIEHRGTANVAKAAERADVQRMTYLSGASIAPDHAGFAPTQAKLDAENAIKASGVAYSIFRASWFMESLPLFVQGKQAFVIGKQQNPVHWIAARDYARMVTKAYKTPEAANKTFPIYGPEAMPMMEALKQYCALIHPGVKASVMPIWMARLLATITRDERLKDVTRLMAYYETIMENENPEEANRLLGAPCTTLRQWCEGSKTG